MAEPRGIEHGNRIAGETRAGALGAKLEVTAALDPSRSLGTWPRSGEPDVEEALRGLEAGSPWSSLSPRRRRALVVRAAEILEEDSEGPSSLAAALGATAGELAVHTDGLARWTSERAPPAAGRGGVSLVVSDWSDLLGGLARRVFDELEEAAGVLVLPDPRLPIAAERVALALERAGVPPGAVAVVHAVDDDGLRRAALAPAVSAIVGSGPPARVQTLEGRADARGGPAVHLDLRIPASGSATVSGDDDVAAAAGRIAIHAFGRGPTLSGQLPGRIGRVLCDPRVLSDLTARLLHRLEGGEGVLPPIPLIDGTALDDVRVLWSLGLDEGATLVHGGEPWVDPAGTSRGRLRVLPTVFTNVEPEMEIARLRTPAPVLTLVRDLRGPGGGETG